MSLADFLKSFEAIIKFDNSNARNFRDIKFFNFTKNETNITNNVLNFNPKDMSDQELSQFLLKAKENGFTIAPADTKLLSLSETYESDSFKEDVLWFQGKIPQADLETLKSAFFLKQKLVNDEPTAEMKEGIRNRFGARGSTICNLFSAQYFKELIKPLYEACEIDTTLGRKTFDLYYETLIEDFPEALFISTWEPEGAVKGKVLSKMAYNKNYGIYKLHLHTVGKTNIKKVLSVAKSICEETPEFEFKITDDKGHYIRLTMFYKQS